MIALAAIITANHFRRLPPAVDIDVEPVITPRWYFCTAEKLLQERACAGRMGRTRAAQPGGTFSAIAPVDYCKENKRESQLADADLFR